MQLIRRILTDILGLSLMVVAPLIGWLPGPGGLPLFIAGLTLLSINHDWAKRLLQATKRHGYRFADRLVGHGSWFWHVVDLVAILVGLTGLALMIFYTREAWLFGLLHICIAVMLGLLSNNRYKIIFKKQK